MTYSVSYYRNLNEFYKQRSGLTISQFTSINATVSPISQFKSFDEIKMPFLISGRLITSGKYRTQNYGKVTLSPEALKSSLEGWVDVQIYTSHGVFDKVMRGEDISVNEVVGKITKTEWNEKEDAIDFFAEIYDKQIAYKMAHGLIRFISVGFARDIVRVGTEFNFMNLEPKEASLVFDPRDKKAEFKPVED